MEEATILLVDDTPENLQLLREILCEEHYKLRAFSEGEFALESAKTHPPDLILLDIKMPGMNGYDVCRHLKADNATRDVPIIFISALHDISEKVKGFSLGAVDYITKPFQAEEVLVRVRTHVALRRAQMQLQEQQRDLERANEELELRVRARTVELADANAALQEDIEKRKEIELQLLTALREIHHRTKNNMQVFDSLLTFQAMYTDDARVKQIFQELRSRIQSMALVHEKLHQNNLNSIDLKEYLEDLSIQVMQSTQIRPNQVAVSLEAESMMMTIDTAVPCGLVLNELLTNAMKHGFPEGRSGQIHIVSRILDDGQKEIRISDNGLGLPEDFNPNSTQSLGLQLVHIITEKQLRGHVEFHRKNSGAEVIIRFKEPHYEPRI